MKSIINLAILLMMTSNALAQNGLLQKQLKFARVKQAYNEKWPDLKRDLKKENYGDVYELYIAAYKSEGKVELWLKNQGNESYKLFKTYNFCEHSGTLGPKLREGDGQTPEGFYQINVFNPESSFHLSLGINYPNQVDLARTGKVNRPGGDIYIHGNCVTVGCIPLTDDKIKEVYLLALVAKNGGQQHIPVHIFPFRMTATNLKKYGEKFPDQIAFWQILQKAEQSFEQNKTLPHIIQSKGQYEIR